MHKIFDLREMDVEQLRTLAESLNIKGYKKMEKDDLVYAVLDEEAKQNALKAPEKKEKPKRGRPRKEETEQKAEQKTEPKQEKPIEKKYVNFVHVMVNGRLESIPYCDILEVKKRAVTA